MYLVVDFVGMTMTTRTTTANFEVLSLNFMEQSAEIKYLGVFTYPKMGVSLKLKLCVRVVVDFSDTRISNLVIEYLREN